MTRLGPRSGGPCDRGTPPAAGNILAGTGNPRIPWTGGASARWRRMVEQGLKERPVAPDPARGAARPWSPWRAVRPSFARPAARRSPQRAARARLAHHQSRAGRARFMKGDCLHACEGMACLRKAMPGLCTAGERARGRAQRARCAGRRSLTPPASGATRPPDNRLFGASHRRLAHERRPATAGPWAALAYGRRR